MSQYTASGKRKSSMTHARRTYTCVCGKECRGNGGWSSHKRACKQWQESRALKRCAAGRDGDCTHIQCPQLRDGEPRATGRHCPLDA